MTLGSVNKAPDSGTKNATWFSKWRRHRRKGHSIMPKLFLVLLATGCLVEFTVGGFYRLLFSHGAHEAIERNVAHYAHYLAEEIGSPPDTAKARLIANQYSLRIRYQGPEGNWDSRPQETWQPNFNQKPSNSEDEKEAIISSEPRSRGTIGRCRGRFCVNISQGQGEFLFVPDFRQMMENHFLYLALVILIVSLVLGGAFLIIRKLLSPLKGLSAAVERLGQGELGHQVPVCGHDEFGELARSFNTMSSRLAALVKAREQLLLDVSHELRSPLTRIKVALELAPAGTDTEGIAEDIREMETMIAEILEAARLDSVHGKLNLENLDIHELVLETVNEANNQTPGVHLVNSHSQLTRPGKVLLVKMDRVRVRKVMANVLENAMKFSQDQNIPVEVTIEEDETSVIVRFKDRGIGIPEQEIPMLFEPFYRVDRSRSRDTGGYGLGLSLCKRIMEAHGGTISVSSQAGSGTVVSLVFPLV
jgi:signal transduction histidine kinase